MKKHIKHTHLPLLSLLLIFIGLLGIACSSRQDTIDQVIIGMWEWNRGDGTHDRYDFAETGILVTPDGEIATFEVADEHTILVKVNGQERVIRVNNYDNDSLVIEKQGEERTYHRVKAVPNLAESILGLWVYMNDGNEIGNIEDSYAIEFTDGNRAISYSVVPNIEIGAKYRILSENSIEIYDIFDVQAEQEKPSEHIIVQIAEATNNSLSLNTFTWPGVYQHTGEHLVLSRVKGHSDLAERIIGLWRDDEFGEELEFTPAGRLIGNTYDVVNYEIISNHTLEIFNGDGHYNYINIVDLTDDTLTFARFGEAYWAGPNINYIEDDQRQIQEVISEPIIGPYTRVQP